MFSISKHNPEITWRREVRGRVRAVRGWGDTSGYTPVSEELARTDASGFSKIERRVFDLPFLKRNRR